MILTGSRADVLTEVMNMGMGYAANALNQLVGTHVNLRVPGVAMVKAWEAQKRIEDMGWIPLSTVQMEFEGSLKGNVALMFPNDGAVKLVSLLTGDRGGHADVDGVRKATLEEAGNILLNGVVGAVSNLLDNQITFSVPYYSESEKVIGHLTKTTQQDAHVILSRAHFNVSEYFIEGEILLYFEVQSLEELLTALDRHMEQHSIPT